MHAVLSAQTANTIKGTEPTFAAISGENRLGFQLNGVTYNEGLGNVSSTTVTTFDPYLTFSDFKVQVLTANDFTVDTDYYDSDNDGADLATPFTLGQTSYTWKDNMGVEIKTAAYNKMIGCDSNYSMPLHLTISLSDVQVHSQYGDPKDSKLTNLIKTYLIEPVTGICYLTPSDLSVMASGNTKSGSYPYGGFDSSAFNASYGFNINSNFPSVAFPKARFKMIMTGSQSDYVFKAVYSGGGEVPTNVVSVDNTSTSSRGTYIFNTKPSGPIAFTATRDNVDYSTPAKMINLWLDSSANMDPGNWNGFDYVRWTDADSYCTAKGGRLPVRSELTNSPYGDNNLFGAGLSVPPMDSGIPGSLNISEQYFKRDDHDSLTAQWGDMKKNQGISWFGSAWTSEIWGGHIVFM